MPFTFAHPAIVLPLGKLPKNWLSMTGLIIGTMTPDFEYFIRMRVLSVYGHTLPGLFWFDIPLALILVFLYTRYVRSPLIRHLPVMLNTRFSMFDGQTQRMFTINNILILAISVLMGAATHIFWDGFTHTGDHFVRQIPLLTKEVSLLGRQIPVFKITQHVSTLIGIIAILLTIYNLPVGKNTQAKQIKPFWLIIVLVTILITAARFCLDRSAIKLAHIIATVIAAAFIGLLVASVRSNNIFIDQRIR